MSIPGRTLALCAIAGLLRGAPPAAGQGPAKPPAFPAGVELITVDAVVVDAQGRPVDGLTRDDFVVTEDGRPQEVVNFEAWAAQPEAAAPRLSEVVASNEVGAPAGGRVFALLVDDLGVTATQGAEVRRTAESFVRSSARDGDAVILATTSGDLWWAARLPAGREDLFAVLARVKGRYVQEPTLDRMTDYEAFRINNAETSPALDSGLSMGPGLTLPERAGSTPAPPVAGGLGGRVKERVKKRWMDAMLCVATSCDQMVRGRAAEIDGLRRRRLAATLASVRRLLGALAPIHGRKSLLLVSPGFLPDTESELRSVVAASREANAAVYFVDVRGLIALPGSGSASDEGVPPLPQDAMAMASEETVLASAGAVGLAEETGGIAIRNTNDLAGAVHRVAVESRVFYLLGFRPPPGKRPGSWRNLRVEVKRPGVTVRARRGYTLAREAAGAGPGRSEKAGALDAERAHALDSPHDEAGIPLRAMAYVLDPRPGGATRVLVAAEVDASSLALPAKGAGRAGRLQYDLVATSRDSGRLVRSDGAVEVTVGAGEAPAWRAFARELELPAGVSQVRAVVRDPAGGRMGSVTQRIEVPPPAAFRLSTPIVSDRLAPAGTGDVHPRPALAVHRVFRPGGSLYCQYEVFGAGRGEGRNPPRVTAGLQVRTDDGRVVRDAPLTPIAADADGRVVRMIGIPMTGLAEGDYELVLDVRDEVTGGRIERHEPFRLASAGTV